jgi:glycosyltransferase involved in cell wall biosynthesis
LFLGYGEGGLEKHVIELANGLADHGHEVLLVCDPRISGRVVPGVQVVEVNSDSSRKSPVLLYRVYKAVANFSPHVLHAHGRKGMQVAMRIKPFLHCAVIGSVHNNRPRRNERLERLDRVVCVSRGVAAGLGVANARVIYNGIHRPAMVHTGRLHEAARPAGAALRLLAVGRLVRDKGIDVLLDAVAMLDGMDLCIAGDGPERARLEQQTRVLGLQGRVTWLGYREDVPALMADADLLVIASRNEGFAYVFAEALMCHLPVVSTDVPIANEVLPPELLSPAGDPAALATCIRRVREADPGQLDQWFESLFEFAEQHLSIDSMIGRIESLYAELSVSS